MQYQTQLQALAGADPTHVFIGDTAAFGYFQANPSQLQDGVHPTNAGYATLAQYWATASLNIVGATLPIPIISGVVSGNVTTMTATITWNTAQPSSSQVKYGTTTSYGSLSTLNSSPVTSHSLILSGLTPGTTYDYAVVSATPAGTAASANFTFSTLSIPLNSTISVVGGARNNTGTSSTPTSVSIPYNSSNGNTIVAVCALGSTVSSISSITDGGSIWTFQAGVNNGTAVRSEIWSTGAGASVASTSFTINISAGTPASCALEEYAGVLHLGATATNAATSGTISVSLPIPEAKDYIVAGLGANSYNGYNIVTGTFRQAGGLTQNQSSNYVETVLCDNTAATATTVGCASVSASTPWAAPALVLRTQ
jgi:hypothetical protein